MADGMSLEEHLKFKPRVTKNMRFQTFSPGVNKFAFVSEKKYKEELRKWEKFHRELEKSSRKPKAKSADPVEKAQQEWLKKMSTVKAKIGRDLIPDKPPKQNIPVSGLAGEPTVNKRARQDTIDRINSVLNSQRIRINDLKVADGELNENLNSAGDLGTVEQRRLNGLNSRLFKLRTELLEIINSILKELSLFDKYKTKTTTGLRLDLIDGKFTSTYQKILDILDKKNEILDVQNRKLGRQAARGKAKSDKEFAAMQQKEEIAKIKSEQEKKAKQIQDLLAKRQRFDKFFDVSKSPIARAVGFVGKMLGAPLSRAELGLARGIGLPFKFLGKTALGAIKSIALKQAGISDKQLGEVAPEMNISKALGRSRSMATTQAPRIPRSSSVSGLDLNRTDDKDEMVEQQKETNDILTHILKALGGTRNKGRGMFGGGILGGGLGRLGKLGLLGGLGVGVVESGKNIVEAGKTFWDMTKNVTTSFFNRSVSNRATNNTIIESAKRRFSDKMSDFDLQQYISYSLTEAEANRKGDKETVSKMKQAKMKLEQKYNITKNSTATASTVNTNETATASTVTNNQNVTTTGNIKATPVKEIQKIKKEETDLAARMEDIKKFLTGQFTTNLVSKFMEQVGRGGGVGRTPLPGAQPF